MLPRERKHAHAYSIAVLEKYPIKQREKIMKRRKIIFKKVGLSPGLLSIRPKRKEMKTYVNFIVF